jgi:hypothetical protein
MGGFRSINLHDRPIAIPPPHLCRCWSAALLGLLGAAAMIVASRRLAGALTHPLEPASLLTAGLLVSASAAAIRLGWFFPPAGSASRRLDQAVMLLTSLSVLALGTGLCVRDTPAAGMFILCTVPAAEEIWAWAWHIRRSRPSPVPRPPSLAPAPRAALPLDPGVAPLSEQVTQQLTRSQTADGTEELSGWLRMSFSAGRRTGSLHVAFCPPFAAVPELEVEQLDGPEARIKTAQLLPYGVRLDLKLSTAADEATTVLLQFSARTQDE